MTEHAINMTGAHRGGRSLTYRQFCVRASVVLLLFMVAMNAGYLLLGHGLIAAMYDSDWGWANSLMSGKAETPLSQYFNAMDYRVLYASWLLTAVAAGLLLSRNLPGVVLSLASLLVCSLLLFLLLDIAPQLVPALHFDLIPYFKYRMDHIPDAELGVLEKPLKHYETHQFRGSAYTPLYRIEETPRTVVVDTDELGFRNQAGRNRADIVVLGSSFPGHGDLLEDTYTSKLEKHTNGLAVANLGMGGYGPVEFVKVLERFGIPKQPRVAILMFHTADVERFLKVHITGEEDYSVRNRRLVFGSFWERWPLAMQQTWNMLSSGVSGAVQTRYQTLLGTEITHPDVAVLELPGNRTERLVILNRHTGMETDDLLNSEVWRLFGEILLDFKTLCESNGIVPVLAYVPWSTEVYAEYTTLDSGQNWLAIRDSQIATAGNDEKAARRLAAEAGIGLISFLPAFKEAARRGELLYLRTDTHWNSEGSELAAQVTAAALQRYLDLEPRDLMKTARR